MAGWLQAWFWVCFTALAGIIHRLHLMWLFQLRIYVVRETVCFPNIKRIHLEKPSPGGYKEATRTVDTGAEPQEEPEPCDACHGAGPGTCGLRRRPALLLGSIHKALAIGSHPARPGVRGAVYSEQTRGTQGSCVGATSQQ